LAGWLGISRQRIDQLIASGTIPRGSDLKSAIKAAYQHQARQAAGREGSAAASAARTASLRAGAELKDMQRRAAEQRLKRESGEWVEATAFNSIVTKIHSRFRTAALALPKQIGRDLHLPPRESDKVRDAVYAMLTALSQGDVCEIYDLKVADE